MFSVTVPYLPRINTNRYLSARVSEYFSRHRSSGSLGDKHATLLVAKKWHAIKDHSSWYSYIIWRVFAYTAGLRELTSSTFVAQGTVGAIHEFCLTAFTKTERKALQYG